MLHEILFFLTVSYFIQIGSLKSGGEVDKRGTTKKKREVVLWKGEGGNSYEHGYRNGLIFC